MHAAARRLVPVLALALGACGGEGGGGTEPASTGTITGSAMASGAGVANASVAMAGGSTLSTDAQGQVTFTEVPVGNRSLTLTPPTGYALGAGEAATKTVTVTSGSTASLAWALRQSGPAPQQATVQLQSASFSPADVRIARGGTVTWTNSSGLAHTITPNDPSQAGTWSSVNVPAQTTFQFMHTFNTAGEYRYNCALHAGMTGVVRVEPSAGVEH